MGRASAARVARFGRRCALVVLLLASASSPAGPAASISIYLDADPATDPRARAALDAVRAQLADLEVSVRVAQASGAGDLRGRLDAAVRASSGQGRSLGALWLDVRAPDDILVFVSDPKGARALVRRIRVPDGSEAAALEETSVVIRSTVTALLEGRTIGMEPVAAATDRAAAPVPMQTTAPGVAASRGPAPPAPAPAAQPVTEHVVTAQPVAPPGAAPAGGGRTRVRFVGSFEPSAAYVGTLFTSYGSWQSGVTLALDYLAPFGGYAGLAYDLFPGAQVSAQNSTENLTLDLVERPASIMVGYQGKARPWLTGGAELAVVGDFVSRSTVKLVGGLGSSPTTDVEVALSPRLRGAVRVTGPVWLVAGAGVDIALGGVSYRIGAPGSEGNAALIQPLPARPRVDLGIRAVVP